MNAMMEYCGVRYATEEEMKAYEKVEKATANDEVYEALMELMQEEDCHDLCVNKVKSAELKKMVKSMGLTIKEVCTWFFMD